MTADEITYVDRHPAIPGHLGTDAPHVHHRGSDRCLRAPDGVACPTLAELRAEVERLEERALGDGQCCWDVCNGGACESCPGCCAGWCVNGHDFSPGDWENVLDAESRERWWGVAREHNAGIDAALRRAESAEAERDALQRQVANAWDEGFEAGHTFLGEYAHGSNGPSDPPANPYDAPSTEGDRS